MSSSGTQGGITQQPNGTIFILGGEVLSEDIFLTPEHAHRQFTPTTSQWLEWLDS